MSQHRKLTDRQSTLLIMVDEATHWLDCDTRPGASQPTYFVPATGLGNWSEFFHEHILVSGRGDSGSLRSLEHRGLITPHPRYGHNFYWYAITEEGILQANKERMSRHMD